MNLFELVAILSLNKKKYDEGLKDAESDASTFGSKLKKGLGTAAKVGGASLAVVGAGAVAVTKKMMSTSSEAAKLGDNIDKQSQKIGISSKAYQEWDFILTHNGASVDSLQSSMKTLSTQASENADEFAELGISQEDLEKSSPEELFETVIKRLQGMESGTKRTAIASKLLGRGATELGPVLNSTSENIEAMRKQAHSLGKVMSDEAVKSGAAYEDSLYNLNTALGGLKNKMSVEFLPSLVKVMDGLTAVFSGDSSAVKKVSEGVESIMGKIVDAIPKIAEIASNIIKTLGNALTKNMPQLVKAAKSIVTSLITTITDNLPAIMDLGLEVIMALIDGIVDALPQIIEGLVGLIVKIVEKLPTIIQKLVEAIPKVITMLIKGLMDNLPKIITGLVNLVISIVNNMPTIIKSLIDDIPTIIKSVIEGLLNSLPQLITGLIQLVAGIVTNIPKIIAGLIGAIPNILKSILSAFGPLGEMLGGLFSGIFDTAKKIFGGIADFIGGIISKAKEAINAMQKVEGVSKSLNDSVDSGLSAKLSTYTLKKTPTMAKGGVLEKGQTGYLEGNGAEAVVPLENNQKWISAVARDMQKTAGQSMTHSGTIRVEGVDKNGNNVDIYDYIIEHTTGVMRRQIRMA